MSANYRFGESEENGKGSVGLLQRSLSAPVQPPEEGGFLAAVMAAGGSMARSTSTNESFAAGKQPGVPVSNSGHKTAQGPNGAGNTAGANGQMRVGISTSEVDTSVNEDLFYPSVSAAAAVTLSPSFGPSSPKEEGIFYSNYLGSSGGSSTWSMAKDQMPPLGLDAPQKNGTAQQQQQHSPRSADGSQYRMRLSSAASTASSSTQNDPVGPSTAGNSSDMYQLRAAMAGMQLASSGAGLPSAPPQQYPPQQQSRGGAYGGVYDQQLEQQMMQMYYGGEAAGYDYGYMGQAPQGYAPRYPPEVYGGAGMGGGGVQQMHHPRGGQSHQMPAMDRYTGGVPPSSYAYPPYDYGISQPQQPRGAGGYGGNPMGGGGRGHHHHRQSGHQQSHQGGGMRGGRFGGVGAPPMQQGWYNGEDYAGGAQGLNSAVGMPRGGGGGGGAQPVRGTMLEEVRSSMRSSSSPGGGGGAHRHHPQHHQQHHGGGGMRGGGGGGSYGGGRGMTGGMYGVPAQQAPHVPAMHYTLADVRGHAVEFAQDQFGSRWLQLQLQSSTVSVEDKQALFLELLPQAKTLAGDTFGNYCVQILLNPQVGTPEQQLTLCKTTFEGNMVVLSRNTYACRCIQSLVKLFQLGDSIIPLALQDSMLRELEPEILSLITDSNANHVAQQIIERIRPIERIAFVLDAMKGRYPELSRDAFGCRVCQRVLEHASVEYVEPALGELLSNVEELITDSMGNYVVQHIITGASSGDVYASQRNRLVEAIKRKLYFYATHKFASNVVEKVLEFGDAKIRREIIQMMLDGQAPLTPNGPMVPMLQMMMSDLFANYVCQRSLVVAERDQLIRLVAIVRGNAHDLRRMTYGKHIISACEKAAAAAGIP